MMCISAYHGIAANWYLLSCLGSGVRVDAERGLAPRIYEGGGKSSAHWYRGEPVIRISFTKAREEEQQTQKDYSI